MKALILAALTLAASASHAIVCHDYRGSAVNLAGDSQTVRLTFQSPYVPASGRMKYTGQRSVSYYYSNGNHSAEINKSVFNGQGGKIWYTYIDTNATHHRPVRVSYTCP